MCRLDRAAAVCLAMLLLFTGCAPGTPAKTPPPTLGPFSPATPAPTPELMPTHTPERRKLWDDGLYVTVPDRVGGNGGLQYQRIYDNYGEIVAGFYAANTAITLHESLDVVTAYDLFGVANFFSYDTLDYVLDDPVLLKTQANGGKESSVGYTLDGRTLVIRSGGKTYRYTLPKDYVLPSDRDEWDEGLYEYMVRDMVSGINDTMICLSDMSGGFAEGYGPAHLILYQTSEDISHWLEGDAYASVHVGDGCAVVTKYDWDLDSREHTVIDGNGKALYVIAEKEYFSEDREYTFTDYTVTADGKVVYEAIINTRQFPDYYYTDVTHELGHGLFGVCRGNYGGVVNAQGEWLVKRLTLDAD